MKRLILLFLLFVPGIVNAATWTNKKPVYTSATTIEGYYEEQVTSTTSWGDITGWESPFQYDSAVVKNITWRYNGAPFLGNDWTIKGQIFTTTESGNSFFKDVPYSIYILTDYGTESCAVDYGGYAGRSGNYTNFTCSGTSTNRMQVVLNAGAFSNQGTWFMLRSDWSQVTTDMSNGSLAGSIGSSISESQKEIINNQEQNTNSINNNINAMGSAINGNIDDMKRKQDETNDLISSDEVDMDGANSFFGDFSDTDHGGISGVITSPLRFINKMTETCSPLSFKVLDADVELPCGDTLFWNKPEVANFRVIWNILAGGGILYLLMCKLFKVIEGLKNPDDSRIEVMKL